MGNEISNANVATAHSPLAASDSSNYISENTEFTEELNKTPGPILANPIERPMEGPMDVDLPPAGEPSSIPQSEPLDDRQVSNNAGGFSYKICDMNRLKRYIVLGSETTTYSSNAPKLNELRLHIQNIQCLAALLKQNRHQEVLQTIKEYSLEGRVPKEDPILTVLAKCATYEEPVVKKAALKIVVDICNIPTKLFRFIDFSQNIIDDQRKENPPKPQNTESEKKRKKRIERSIKTLNINDNQVKVPSENIDTSLEPVKKKKKKKNDEEEPEFKKVNGPGKKSTGWGRMRRRAIAEFYSDDKKEPARLLYLMTKYKQRHNWSHNTVLSYSHPKMVGDYESLKNLVIKYCTSGYDKVKDKCDELKRKAGVDEKTSQLIQYIEVLNKVSNLSPENEDDKRELLEILNTYGIRQQPTEFTSSTTFKDVTEENTKGLKSPIQIVREHIPTEFLNMKEVWEILLVDMPMTALIRSLSKMTSLGLFEERKNLDAAIRSLTNVHKLKTARIHPVKILIALETYKKGEGRAKKKGGLKWEPNNEILTALDSAFYKSFKQPELQGEFKTNRKYMLCLDVSGSMSYGGCVGCEHLSPAVAAFAMAWVTWNIEEHVEVMAFGGRLEDMKTWGFTKDMKIHDVVNKSAEINFGATDCSLPMVHALQRRMEVDVFIIYTDCDTWIGDIHPVTALRKYNAEMGCFAKLIVCAMQSNGFTIADPEDPNMMDIVGFDANVPELISEFAKGNLDGKCSGGNCPDCG